METIEIYTDGSCHTQLLTGSWAAIVLAAGEQIRLCGTASNTTHNRMELQAIIEALRFAGRQWPGRAITVFSDSQYAVGLKNRKQKILAANFMAKTGNATQNADLLKELWALEETMQVTLVKVPAHQPSTGVVNYNTEVDLLVRKVLREGVGTAVGDR